MKIPLRVAVLGSTRGTDTQAVIDEIEAGKLNAKITVVISNVENAGILEKARNHRIPAVFVNPIGPKGKKSREEFDREAVKVVQEYGGSDLNLLIGYMRIFSPWFVRLYGDTTWNIHPALLPQAAGMMDLDVHKLMIDRGAWFTGCTLIAIDEGADTGPIISQAVVRILPDDTPDILKTRVQLEEQRIILESLRLFIDGKIKIKGKKVTNPKRPRTAS